jgi:osmotically-inducible protein OsmY
MRIRVATMMWTDSDIKQDVLAELIWEPMVNAAHVGVEVDDGEVTLIGTVENGSASMAAERAALRVDGVRAVANGLSVRGSVAENGPGIALAAAVGGERNGTGPSD